jgi:hypothetical protein
LFTSIQQTVISVGGRERLGAIIVSWAIADAVGMGTVVGRKPSTTTAMMAPAHTTVQVTIPSFWQTRVSVRGRDRLDLGGLGAMSSAAAVSVEMGGLGA